MAWIASFHGDTAELGAADAEAAERALLEQFEAVALGLGPAGHTGIAGTFYGHYTGDVNLLQLGATPDGAGEPAGQDGRMADGTMAAGFAEAPTAAAPPETADADAQSAPAAPEGSEATPDTPAAV